MSVLITGASSGIGAATARLLARAGTTVGLVGRRADRLAEVLEGCRASAPDSRMWVADLGDLALAERVAVEAWDSFGGLDALINNAAMPKVRAVPALTVEDVEHAMRVNFFSPVRDDPHAFARGCWPEVRHHRQRGQHGRAAGYPARSGLLGQQFALTGWSEAIAMDLHDTPIRVRLIQPGAIDTDIWDRPGEEQALYVDGPKESPELVAEGIVDAIGSTASSTTCPT